MYHWIWILEKPGQSAYSSPQAFIIYLWWGHLKSSSYFEIRNTILHITCWAYGVLSAKHGMCCWALPSLTIQHDQWAALSSAHNILCSTHILTLKKSNLTVFFFCCQCFWSCIHCIIAKSNVMKPFLLLSRFYSFTSHIYVDFSSIIWVNS